MWAFPTYFGRAPPHFSLYLRPFVPRSLLPSVPPSPSSPVSSPSPVSCTTTAAAIIASFGFGWDNINPSHQSSVQVPLDVTMLKDFGLLDNVYYRDQMFALLAGEVAR